jgi:hypothetical protein
MISPLTAMARGKVPGLTRSEDALTGAVLGTLRWLPRGHDLATFLCMARLYRPDGTPGARRLPIVRLDQVIPWPWWDRSDVVAGAEPDAVALVELESGEKAFVVVEAKHLSGKSGHGDRDQLLRQWENARALRGQTHDAHTLPDRFLGIVYLTSHLAMPRDDLQASWRAIAMRHGPPDLYWLSWRDALPLIDSTPTDAAAFHAFQAAIAADLAHVLRRAGLQGFGGWSEPPPPPTWRFTSTWRFDTGPPAEWTFSRSTT